MAHTMFTSSLVVGGGIGAVAMIAGGSVAMGANVSTAAFLVALVIAPGILVAVLAGSAPSPTVAQILHSVETKGGRS